ncbi:MAG: hypothetical protein JO020_07920, partial [Chloroflexi bacterium]|nr:hypothetical protein [Chloroflexota bacterium]
KIALPSGRTLRLQGAARDRTTPQLLMLAMGGTWVLIAVVFLLARSGLSDVRSAAQTIGHDSEPSVLYARQIGLSLADMHASVANAFLLGPGHDADAWNTYQQERQTVADNLVNAAQNITYAGEKDQINILSENFVGYQDLISQAEAAESQNPATGISVFNRADDLVHNTLSPAANELARINNDALDQSYQSHRSTGIVMAIVVGFAGLLLVLVLLATQVFLSRRTRRTFNVWLIGATVLSVAIVAIVAGTLGAASEHLRSAKQDAYDSLYALTSARTVSYDANADESLWLLAQENARYETSFMSKTRQISDPWLTDSSVQGLPQYVDDHKPVPFSGYLANELNNITFAGEREAALSAATYWAKYLAIDSQIRSLDRGGDHAGAVALDIGTNDGQSNWAFDAYDQYLAQTIDINQKEFDRSIQQIFNDLGGATSFGADTILPILTLAAAVLVWFGLQPRIAEYR